jgi:hypothetical protein
VALLTNDKEAVRMVRIQKGVKVCPLSTEALLMAVIVRPCVMDGEKLFEEAEAVDWQEEMRDSTWEHKERMELVFEARIEEMDNATREERVYVVHCTPRLVTSANQARQLGKDILAWLSKECVIEKLLPEGMVKPEKRTEDHVAMVVDHWLEHGELSTVAKRAKTHQRNRFTQQRDRAEPDSLWVVT